MSNGGLKISGLQWFFLRSKNPVYFAIHVRKNISETKFQELVRWALQEIPTLAGCYDRETDTLAATDPDEFVAAAEYRETSDLAENWNQFLQDLPNFCDQLDGKMFRASCFVAPGKTRHGGSLILFAALHAAIEGVDLANLLRGKLDGKAVDDAKPKARSLVAKLRGGLYTLTGLTIVVSSHVLARVRSRPAATPAVRHISLERRGLRRLAREYDVSQKALLFAFARYGINQIGPKRLVPGIGKRTSLTFTEYASPSEWQDDPAIKMRLRADLFAIGGNVKSLAKRFDKLFSRKTGKPYIFQRLNNSAIGANRAIERIFPSLYGDSMFDYLPFSECYTLLPPNKLRGHLSGLADGTVLTGSMPRGLDIITFCPAKDHIHIAFKTEPERGAVAQHCLDAIVQSGLKAQRVALER